MTDKAPQSDAPDGERLSLDQPAMLTCTNADGVVALTCGPGNLIPGTIPVVDDEGRVLAVYNAGPVVTPKTATSDNVGGIGALEVIAEGGSGGGSFTPPDFEQGPTGGAFRIR
ncbi:hypothetical protein AB0J38_18980 [Streptomyces sp. NPDC050095]|uniref:hypothetical protein n=1 Tax=unclassified Streptomyces TaxID=2593676 RepID=UPI00342176BE